MLSPTRTASTTQATSRTTTTAVAIREGSGPEPIASFLTLPAAALTPIVPDPYAEYYLGNQGGRWTDPAKNAYDSAVAVLKKDLSLDQSLLVWLRDKTSMADVQSALETAAKEYQNKDEGSKVRQWLASCSSRIMYYGAIFDVYVQHHPEYVSLAWGTFKFLFIAVLNHEELLVELAKAISRIAEVLPRTELHAELYPTKRIQQAVSVVYAKVIEFSIRAIKWYKKRKLAHSISSIVKPFSLSFKDIIAEISERSRRVDELAGVAAKAEIRDLHVNIHDLSQKVDRLTDMMVAYQTLQTNIMADLRDQKQFFRNSQIEDINNAFLEYTEMSTESLSYCRSLRNRRRRSTPVQLPASELIKLKAWLSEPSSSILLARSQGMRTSGIDFATDFLDAVLEKGYPVIWALPYGGRDDLPPLTPAGVLKSLVLQVLAANPNILSEGLNPVRMPHLTSASTVEHWFKILVRVLTDTPQILIVIDIRLIEMAAEHGENGGDIVELINEMVKRRVRGGLKVVLVSSRFKAATSLELDDISGGQQIFTDRGRQMERLLRQPKYKAISKRQNMKLAQRFKATIQEST